MANVILVVLTPKSWEKLAERGYIICGLKQLTGGDDRSVRIWLKAPHPALDGDSPIDLMRTGETDIVQKLVDHMLSGAAASSNSSTRR